MDRNSLYDDIKFIYEKKDSIKGIYGKIHQCHFDYEAVHKNFVISINSNIPNELKDKVYIAKKEKNDKYSYKKSKWKDNFILAKTRDFGEYCIVADTVSPLIKALNLD